MTEPLRFPVVAQPSIRGAVLRIPDWRIRLARAGDEPFLRRLYQTLRADELARAGWPEEMRASFCNSQFDLQHRDWTARFPLAQFLIVQADAQPIGRLYADLSSSRLHLIEIGLLPAWRGRGFGAACLGELQRRARSCDGEVHLSVLKSNHRAAALYARHGFAVTEDLGSHHSLCWRPS